MIRYLKILYGFSILLIAMFILHFMMLFLFPETIANENGAILYQPQYMFVEFMMLLIFIAICFCTVSFNSGIKKGLFEDKAALYLKIGALLLLAVGILSLINDLLLKDIYSSDMEIIYLVTIDALFLIIGFGTLFTADVLKSGVVLRAENDLTI